MQTWLFDPLDWNKTTNLSTRRVQEGPRVPKASKEPRVLRRCCQPCDRRHHLRQRLVTPGPLYKLECGEKIQGRYKLLRYECLICILLRVRNTDINWTRNSKSQGPILTVFLTVTFSDVTPRDKWLPNFFFTCSSNKINSVLQSCRCKSDTQTARQLGKFLIEKGNVSCWLYIHR